MKELKKIKQFFNYEDPIIDPKKSESLSLKLWYPQNNLILINYINQIFVDIFGHSNGKLTIDRETQLILKIT
jgi:hypothetical protein